MNQKQRVISTSIFIIYLSVQLFFIVRAHFIHDKRFGFWMFAESAFFTAKLYRELEDGSMVPTSNGRWTLTEPGKVSGYNWNQLVRDYRLYNLQDYKRAKGSMSRTMMYFQHALDYVADHIPQDQSTRRLVLKVNYHESGEPWQNTTLKSKVRDL